MRWPFGRLEPWQRNQYVVVLTVAAANVGFNFFQPFLPLYVRYLGVTDVSEAAFWSGLLVGVTPLVSSSLAPLWGALADRVGYKLLVLRALFGISLCALLLAVVPNVVWALWLRIAMGFIAGFTPMAMALAVRTGPRERVGQAVGMIQAAQFLPLAFGPFVGGLLTDRFDIRINFVLAGVITALAGVLLIFLLREERTTASPTPPRSRKETGGRRGLLGVLALPGFGATLVVLFLAQSADRSLQPILPLYLVEINTPPEQLATVTGLIISAGAIAASLSSAGFGRLARPGQTRWLVAASVAGGSLAMLALPLVSFWGGVLGLRVLLGVASGGGVSLAFTLGARLVPPERAGLALGVLSACTGLGGAFAPLLGGIVGSHSLTTVFLANAALYGLAFLLTLTVLAPADRAPRLEAAR